MTSNTKNFHPDTDTLGCTCGCGLNRVVQDSLDKLQLIRDDFGKPMVVTSGFRCPNHPIEARKGKDALHRHCSGKSFDVRCRNSKDRYALVKLAMKYGAKGIGIRGDIVHIDWFGGDEDKFLWLY